MTDDRPKVPCSACAELIFAEARKCRHCGELQAKAGSRVPPVKKFRPPDSDVTTILIPGILGIFAWTKGNDYLEACRKLGCEPKSAAVAGRILGIVGTCLWPAAALGGGSRAFRHGF